MAYFVGASGLRIGRGRGGLKLREHGSTLTSRGRRGPVAARGRGRTPGSAEERCRAPAPKCDDADRRSRPTRGSVAAGERHARPSMLPALCRSARPRAGLVRSPSRPDRITILSQRCARAEAPYTGAPGPLSRSGRSAATLALRLAPPRNQPNGPCGALHRGRPVPAEIHPHPTDVCRDKQPNRREHEPGRFVRAKG
jgi:hypothetical protein